MKKLLLTLCVLLFLGITLVNGQTRKISGVVKSSEDGQTLPGVSIVVKGTTTGTTTNLDGKYEISVSADATTLVFSFIGMKAQEVPINGRAIIDVELAPETASLDEVVVVGFGTRLKSDLTGSISQVKAEDIANVTQPSFESAIQGKTSGVYVQSGSGKLGQGIKMRIRGSSSVSANNQPLYVVDNIAVNTDNIGDSGNEATNPMADFNPADIESIQVLKDASASAIYGARAANGVVIITTKRGKEGKTNFNFSSQIGFSEPAKKVGFMNRDQYLKLFEEAFNNTLAYTGDTDIWGAPDYQTLLDWVFPYWRDPVDPNNLAKGPNTNWENQALRKGSLRQYDLTASGGNEKTKFFTSLSMADQEAVIVGNSFDRISARLNLDQKANNLVSFGLSLNPVRTRNFRVANDNAFSQPLQMVALPPLDPVYIPGTTTLNKYTVYENGMIPLKYNSFNAEIYRSIGNVYATFNLLPSLTFRTEAGMDLTNQREKGYQGRLTNDGGPYGNASDRTVTLLNTTSNSYFTFDKTYKENYNVNLVGGMSYQEAVWNTASVYAINFPSDDFKRIDSAAEITGAGSNGTNYSFLSYFLRSNLKFFDKYLITFSGRIDGSSRFGKNSRYGFFPAGSVAWIVSKEKFMSNQKIVSFLKLRTSWGVTGNAEIGNFSSRGLYQASNYAGYSGLVPGGIASPDLKWETTKQTDFGIDFGFLDNRITGEFDYYIKKTSDLLLNVTLPSTNGYTSVTKNVGNLENKGWEFVINTNNLTGEFQWNTSFNISANKNKITNLGGKVISTGIWRAMENYPIGVFYTKKFAGVDPANGDALFYTDATRTTTTNILSQAANQVVGDPNPDFVGGITNNFKYKGFDLNFVFQFVHGNDIFNGGRQWQADGLSYFDNQTLDIYNSNRWKTPGQITNQPQSRFDMGNGYGISSMLVFDGSYIRLKDITLGYTVPTKLISRVGLTSVRVFAKGLNVWTKTKYPGWDPETNFTGTGASAQTQNLQQGYDFYTSPQPRTITFGLQLGF